MKSNPQILNELKQLKHAIVTTHIAPDADAVGAGAALVLGLKELGADASLYLGDEFPERMSLFVSGVPISFAAPTTPFPALIVVDSASINRIGDDHQRIAGLAGQIFNFDHHISNEGWGDWAWIDENAASSTEIVYSVLVGLDVIITTQIANLLLAGLMDDTGCFRYLNTKQSTFELAAKLMELSASPRDVANQLYFNVPERMLRVRSAALAQMTLIAGGKITFIIVTKEMLTKCGATRNDTEGIVDEARLLEGTLGAVLVKELEDGCWKISLRSKTEDLDVNQIAAMFGGGGHKAAAGCKICGSRKEVEQKLVSVVEKAVLEGKCRSAT